MTIKTVSAIFVTALFAGCGSKPADSDIRRKILMEYVCFETARVNNLQVLEIKDAESISGKEAYEYVVAGEIEWPNGCTEFGTGTPPGSKEKFDKKSVFLVKGDDGVWQ